MPADPFHGATAPELGLVIIGSGLAGYTVAREFRKLDRVTPVTVVTADGGEVYAKPMLSNFFGQKKTLESLVQKQSGAVAEELGGTILSHHRVVSIDRKARTFTAIDATGVTRTIGWRRLVLALGADPRPYEVAGSDTVPVATVNSLDDYRRFLSALPTGGTVLLIGAGLIGSEFANDLIAGGYRVTVVDPAAWPLGRLVPKQVGDALAEALREAGATLHLGHSIRRLEVGAKKFVAFLDDGTEISFDRALSAIGLLPRTAIAREAGLDVAQGVVVDRLLRTSDPDIFAVGDCAQTPVGVLSFVLPLMAQARAVAATLAGTETPLRLPALPVAVKTPALPIVVCAPRPDDDGGWEVEGSGRSLKAIFSTAAGAAGFALSGASTIERQAFTKNIPELFG